MSRRPVVVALVSMLALGGCAHHPHGATPSSTAGERGTPATTGARIAAPPPPPAMAQTGPLWFLRGAVVDTHSGKPLENAAVVVLSRRDSVTTVPPRPSIATGADGRFMLDFTSPGDYEIKVAALGYRTRTVVIHVAREGAVPYRVFRLSPLPVAEEIPAGAAPSPQEPHAP